MLKELFDSAASTLGLLVGIYVLLIILRCWGFEFLTEDHKMVLGALLAVLRPKASA